MSNICINFRFVVAVRQLLVLYVILAVARGSDCPYGRHAALARKSAIDDDEILVIADGAYGEFPGPEHAAMSYAVAHVRHTVTDETHAQIAEQIDDGDVVTLGILASEDARVCSGIDTLGVDLDDEFVGWDLDSTSSGSRGRL